jgi:hypothetical protein
MFCGKRLSQFALTPIFKAFRWMKKKEKKMPIKNIEILLRLVTHFSFRAQLGTYSPGKGTHTLAQSSVTNSTIFFFLFNLVKPLVFVVVQSQIMAMISQEKSGLLSSVLSAHPPPVTLTHTHASARAQVERTKL